MARRALKLASWTSAALAASGFYLYSNKYLDPSDFGAVRVGRAVATTAVISYDYLTSLRSVPYGSEEYLQLRSKVHLRSARRLFELCCANRGTFIKVGQHLGALDYLLPEEYTSTLKVLHSQAPQSSIQEVRQVIREDLGQEIQDLFVSFDDTPLGAASLAQVHKAVLRDGRTVAVKVQHPKVQAQSSKDILLMEVLVLAVKQLFPEFEFMWLVDEAKKNLPLELDFLNEGRNAEKVAQMLKHFDFLKISCHLGKMYSEMIFVNGFVHCDPHPGNVLVRKRPDTGKAEIVLLDHGLYQVLTDEFRLDYCHLWQSLIWTDMEKVKKYSQRLGAGELYPLFACMLTARSWDSVNKGIGQASVTATEVGGPLLALPSPKCGGWGHGWPLDPFQPRVWGSGLVGCALKLMDSMSLSLSKEAKILGGEIRNLRGGAGDHWGNLSMISMGSIGDLLGEKHPWRQGGRENSVSLCLSWPHQPAHGNCVIHTAVPFAPTHSRKISGFHQVLLQDFRESPGTVSSVSLVPLVPLASFLYASLRVGGGAPQFLMQH
ncbi:aarF domain-containing protein kinase 1 isoform X2 [Mirounga leonina]|uniref:aarF domain-containing protein kinase 1 isoform X2 n=1 Tax=Mirounga leonina TaxID=9715 RepID=UPI00156BFF5D|nr:aarF domain-containing protein kinase 1 isoform X2 [Mirounga leonina]